MQTFLPFGDYARSARVLDKVRVLKQAVECKQIIRTHQKLAEERKNPGTHETIGWARHPAVVMWTHALPGLAIYMQICVDECLSRGIMIDKSKFTHVAAWAGSQPGASIPWWFGGDIHMTHQYNLCAKHWDHYGPLFPEVLDSLVGEVEYYWPEAEASEAQPYWGQHVVPNEWGPNVLGPGPALPFRDPGFRDVVLDTWYRLEKPGVKLRDDSSNAFETSWERIQP